MATSNDTVIGAYEVKIAGLEKDKLRLMENAQNGVPAAGRLEDMLELSQVPLKSVETMGKWRYDTTQNTA